MKKIMIVENNRESAERASSGLKKSLKDIGIDMFLTGKEALENSKKQAYDLVVSESALSDMSGFEFFRALEESGAHCPVIIVSSPGMSAEAIKYMRLGAYDYIVKDGELIDSAQRALDLVSVLKEKELNEELRFKIRRYQEHSTITRVFNDEINNPLMTIIGNVQLLISRPELDKEKSKSKLMAIEKAAQRIARAAALFNDPEPDSKNEFTSDAITRNRAIDRFAEM